MTTNSQDQSFTITTGSRLHFGLTRIRPVDPMRGEGGKFGGLGAMIEHPKTVLRIANADRFESCGSDRVEEFTKAWSILRKIDWKDLKCRISVLERPPSHSGLGSGTQLAQSVAMALDLFNSLERQMIVDKSKSMKAVAESAAHLSRGHRSMIGSYGFALGGLLADAVPTQTGIAKLAFRHELPEAWRAVLTCPKNAVKKFGIAEKEAFRQLILAESQRKKQTRIQRELEQLIELNLMPSAQTSNFEQFCDSLHEYGKLSGEIYTKVQGGIYNGPVITKVVNDILQMGGRGVGQSSWGPVIFSWTPDEPTAQSLRKRLASHFGDEAEVWITKVRNTPASTSQPSDPHESLN